MCVINVTCICCRSVMYLIDVTCICCRLVMCVIEVLVFAVTGLMAKVTQMKSRTSVGAALQELCVTDPTPKATYPKVVILCGY